MSHLSTLRLTCRYLRSQRSPRPAIPGPPGPASAISGPDDRLAPAEFAEPRFEGGEIVGVEPPVLQLVRRAPVHGIVAVPPLGPQRPLVDLVGRADRELRDPHEPRCPLRAQV